MILTLKLVDNLVKFYNYKLLYRLYSIFFTVTLFFEFVYINVVIVSESRMSVDRDPPMLNCQLSMSLERVLVEITRGETEINFAYFREETKKLNRELNLRML